MGNSTDAEYQGTRVVTRRYNQTTSCSISYGDKQETVTEITSRSCRILHGSYSWLASAVKLGIGDDIGDDIEHWWMIIKTATTYYVIQFCRNEGSHGTIEMRKCSSWRDCNECGLAQAAKTSDADMWTESKYSYKWNGKSSKPSKSIGDVVQYLDYFDANYSLLSNNCQDLCRKMYAWF